jgi:hypothetical protein
MKIKIADKEYGLDRLMLSEAEAIEKVTGQKMQDALSSGSATSLKALAWVAMKREDPSLRFSDVDFALEDIDVIGDDEEADPTPDPEAATPN